MQMAWNDRAYGPEEAHTREAHVTTKLKASVLAAGVATMIGASSGTANAAATELTLVYPFPTS